MWVVFCGGDPINYREVCRTILFYALRPRDEQSGVECDEILSTWQCRFRSQHIIEDYSITSSRNISSALLWLQPVLRRHTARVFDTSVFSTPYTFNRRRVHHLSYNPHNTNEYISTRPSDLQVVLFGWAVLQNTRHIMSDLDK